MTFCIITHVAHGYENHSFYAYSPYVREMNIWSKYVDKIILVAPLTLNSKTAIEENYLNKAIDFRQVNSFNFLSIASTIKTLFKLPKIIYVIYSSMKAADHIHLRCPGNMGLLGCLIQIFFPKKKKTAKYAGNWGPNSKQPMSYKIQRWILNNTFLTKNMSVLVYGDWEKSSTNIKPFFTATYKDSDKKIVEKKDLNGTIQFLFVGSLTKGKNPLYAIQLIQKLYEKKRDVSLSIYGNGVEFNFLKAYIKDNNLTNFVKLIGNKTQEEVREAYQKKHFVILPSKSEGWPKVLAEGMFWGCLPIATKVSCIPNMLNHGERGILLDMNIESDVAQIEKLLLNQKWYQLKIDKSVEWSRKYTLDFFEEEIKKLLIE